jgi:hypothetical protein
LLQLKTANNSQMNLLAQNQPTQRLPGRIVSLLIDAPEQDAPYFAHYYLAHRAELLAKSKDYREANRERISAQRRARYATNRAKILDKAQRYYATNKRYREAVKRRANARYARIKDAQ